MMNKYKIEFHVHTCYSKDSVLTYPFLLFMLKLKRINCIAVTDHNEIYGAVKYKEKLSKHSISVIIGEEIFSSDGEIIGLFLKEKIPANLTAEETVKRIKEQGGIVYVPHPYDNKRAKTVLKKEKISKLKKEIDFIEIHNGRNISDEYSIMQEKIQKEYNINPIIGSDAHTFYELGRNYCIVNSIDKNDIVESIINAEFKKKKCIKFAHFNTKIAKLIKLIKGGNVNEIFRIINKRLKKSK